MTFIRRKFYALLLLTLSLFGLQNEVTVTSSYEETNDDDDVHMYI